MVITGASSGIGLTTARMAARAGAKVVLTARDEATLHEQSELIRREGGQATYLAGDVANPTVLQNVARHAVATFGRIDTWVNNAGVGIYGLAEEVSLADMRRLFDVNFWGMVHGSLAAIPELRKARGALINVGSIESEIATPYHSAYAAAKHAVKGYTDALRLELEQQDAAISVTLVKPAAIDTPFFDNARNYLDNNPKPPPPAYTPEVVARTILHCAHRPVREIVVGGAGRAFIGLQRRFPRTSDYLFEKTLFSGQQTDKPTRTDRAGSLHRPGRFNGRQRGQYDGYVRTRSYSTAFALQPGPRFLGFTLLGVAMVGAARMLRASSTGKRTRIEGVRRPALSDGARDRQLPADVRVTPIVETYVEFEEQVELPRP
jgi:short-subunit dehydrogenase